MQKVCKNGHSFFKSSDCPTCPSCSRIEMKASFPEDFPNIGAPARRALNLLGIHTLEDLTRYSEEEISDLHGMGPKAVSILKRALETNKLSFREEKSKSTGSV